MSINKLKINYKEQVKPKHKERVKKIIRKTSLPSLSSNWTVTESDGFKDRVYLFNHNNKMEYSIAFSDVKDGYNYCIYKRVPIGDKEYEAIIKHRPELVPYGREALATVTEVEKGFQKELIYKKENSFEKMIKEKKFNLSENNGDMLILKISTPDNAFNHCLTIFPRLKQAMGVERISLNKVKDILKDMGSFFELFKEAKENPQIIEIETNEPDTILNDALDFLQKDGFKILMGRDDIRINE